MKVNTTTQFVLQTLPILLFLLIFNSVVKSQPGTEWQRAVGDSSRQAASGYYFVPTNGGNLILGSGNEYLVSNQYYLHLQLYKTDFNGNTLWEKQPTSAIINSSTFYSVSDGKGGLFYAAACKRDYSEAYSDLLVGQISSLGDSIWQMEIGDNYDDIPTSLTKTRDGGFIISANYGTSPFNWNLWLLKFSPNGLLEWEKKYGGSDNEGTGYIFQLNNNNYTFFGYTASSDGMVKDFHGSTDFWIANIDSAGNMLSQKALGGSQEDNLVNVIQTTDKGYLLTGFSNSNDGDVGNNYGSYDGWIVKLDSALNIQWKNVLGGSDDDILGDGIFENSAGDYVCFGTTNSTDGDVKHNHGNYDIWAIKISKNGDILWNKQYGSSAIETTPTCKQATNDQYYFACETNGTDGDLAYDTDTITTRPIHWLVKLSDNGDIIWQKNLLGYELPPNIYNTTGTAPLTVGLGSIESVPYQYKQDDFILTKLCDGFADTLFTSLDSYTICKGDSVMLEAIPGFQKYLWSNGDTSRITFIKNSGNYTVRIFDNKNCSANSYPAIKVQVNPLPEKSITANGVLSFCEGGSVKFTADETNATYLWNTGEQTRSVTKKITGSYYAVITNQYGCSINSDTSKVTVYPKPAKPVIEYINDTLHVNFVANSMYSWYLNNTLLPDANKNYLRPETTGSYTVQITNGFGCSQISKPFNLSILAVSVVSFSGTLSQNDVKLSWTTAQSKTNYFKVQRSIDGLHFIDINMIKAVKNLNSITTYNYTDTNAALLASELYYRLMEIDIDGTTNYSKTISFNTNSPFAIIVSPNPVNSSATITASEDIGKANIMITDVKGRIYKIYNKNIYKGIPISFDISNLSSGLYLIKILSAQFDAVVVRVVKL